MQQREGSVEQLARQMFQPAGGALESKAVASAPVRIRSVSPEPRGKSPTSAPKSPESRAKSPESRAKSPVAAPKSPESRAKSPARASLDSSNEGGDRVRAKPRVVRASVDRRASRDSGSGSEESGSGPEESGSGSEESGSGPEESGSGPEESGSGPEEDENSQGSGSEGKRGVSQGDSPVGRRVVRARPEEGKRSAGVFVSSTSRPSVATQRLAGVRRSVPTKTEDGGKRPTRATGDADGSSSDDGLSGIFK
jgi:hypothetical protein